MTQVTGPCPWTAPGLGPKKTIGSLNSGQRLQVQTEGWPSPRVPNSMPKTLSFGFLSLMQYKNSHSTAWAHCMEPSKALMPRVCGFRIRKEGV